MKKLLFSACILACVAGYADQTLLKPLWEEEQHFLYYRCLFLERSVSSLEGLVDFARDNPSQFEHILDMMEKEVENCKCALGV
jgi:hypothetical protein